MTEGLARRQILPGSVLGQSHPPLKNIIRISQLYDKKNNISSYQLFFFFEYLQ